MGRRIANPFIQSVPRRSSRARSSEEDAVLVAVDTSPPLRTPISGEKVIIHDFPVSFCHQTWRLGTQYHSGCRFGQFLHCNSNVLSQKPCVVAVRNRSHERILHALPIVTNQYQIDQTVRKYIQLILVLVLCNHHLICVRDKYLVVMNDVQTNGVDTGHQVIHNATRNRTNFMMSQNTKDRLSSPELISIVWPLSIITREMPIVFVHPHIRLELQLSFSPILNQTMITWTIITITWCKHFSPWYIVDPFENVAPNPSPFITNLSFITTTFCCRCYFLDVPSGPLSARTERDAVLQGTAVFTSYLPVYAGFRDTMGWGGVGQWWRSFGLDHTLVMLRHALGWSGVGWDSAACFSLLQKRKDESNRVRTEKIGDLSQDKDWLKVWRKNEIKDKCSINLYWEAWAHEIFKLDSTIKTAHKTFIYTYIYICLYLYIYRYGYVCI